MGPPRSGSLRSLDACNAGSTAPHRSRGVPYHMERYRLHYSLNRRSARNRHEARMPQLRNCRPPRPLRGRCALVVALSIATLTAGADAQSAPPAPRASAPAARLPDRLTDAEFWTLVSDISEPGGYFRNSDNFTSNEREIGQLFTQLRHQQVHGGVYLGVGPEQNFTYIAAIRPAMAFIVDIRRQAVMQHLMFKAIFELADDRADFISLLFARPRPAGLERNTPIQKIWDAYWDVTSDSAAAARNYARIVEHLTRAHGFTFTSEESAQLKWVFDAFYGYGPVISTRGAPGGFGGGNGTTFADLTGYSVDETGQPQSFLSSAENYAYVKGLHEKNLIVPVSGDFGGPKAIRAIGSWLRQRGGTVSAFYVSNVEQYLFGDAKQSTFYANVATLPVTATSIFIRPYAVRRVGPVQALCAITPFLAAVHAGHVYSYNEALACVK